jgi:hypothetical protein
LAAQTRSSSIHKSGVIQLESNTFPSRLEVQRLVVTWRSQISQRMDASVRWLVMFPLAVGFGAPSWAVDCRQLQEQRDQLARRAMAAEVALVHAQRQKLCPQLEALATAVSKTTESTAGASAELDYGAYIRCREQAEMQLTATRPVLYKNSSGFPFLTPDGARLARQADAQIKELQASCSAPPSGPEQSPPPSRPGT